MRTGRATGLVALTIVLFTVAAAVPAGAQIHSNLEPFSKPDWELTMKIPTGWDLNDESDVIWLTWVNLESVIQDWSLLAVAQDPAYADPEMGLDEIFEDVISKTGLAFNLDGMEPSGERTIAREDARGMSFSATDPDSGRSFNGLVYQFAKADMGYATISMSLVGAWVIHNAFEFPAVLDSIRIGPEPTVTPTATKRPTRTPRPTPTPTEPEETPMVKATKKPATATPEAELEEEETTAPSATATGKAPAKTPTPKTGVPTKASPKTGAAISARQAYDLALPVAREWSAEAALASIEGMDVPWRGAGLGKCGQWVLAFLESTDAGAGVKAYRLIVSGGKANPGEVVEMTAAPAGAIAGDWIDSTQAMQAFLDNFGASFMRRHPQARIAPISLKQGEDGLGATWTVLASARAGNVRQALCAVDLDAADGAVDVMAETAVPGGAKLLTAREAFQSARAPAEAWQMDARLVSLRSIAMFGEEGQFEGKASTWTAWFVSTAAKKSYEVRLNGEEVTTTEQDMSEAQEPVTGEWPDSPQVADDLKASGDYADFQALYPEHSLGFWLTGNKGAGYTWEVGAVVTGITLVVKVQSTTQ
jgi:hypothetical protein